MSRYQIGTPALTNYEKVLRHASLTLLPAFAFHQYHPAMNILSKNAFLNPDSRSRRKLQRNAIP